MLKRFCWLTLSYFIGVVSAHAADDVLDIIPGDAVLAVAIRNLDDVQEKGDKLFADAGIKTDFRPSDLFRFGYDYLGINRSVDKKGSAALVLAANTPASNDYMDVFNSLVAVIPYRDLDDIGADLGFARGELKPEIITASKEKPRIFKHYYARRNHLYMGVTDAALKKVIEAEPLRKAYKAEQLDRIDSADLLVHVKPTRLHNEWEKSLDQLSIELRAGADPEEQQLVGDLISTLKAIESDTIAFYLEEAMRIENVAIFDTSNKGAARNLLARLAKEPGASTLRGLPSGNILAAHAVQGDGSTNTTIVRVLLKLITPGLDRVAPALRFANRPAFFGVFTEIWQRLQGSRLAIYLNEDGSQHGLVSAVAILDTENPDEFIDEMRKLADLAAAADVEGKGKAITEEEIQALVRQLGSPKFAERRSANTKLALIGDPALPHLKKGMEDKDQEISDRSRALVAQLTKDADERRKRLLAEPSFQQIEPKFAYVPPRKDDVIRAHIMQVHLGDKQAEAEKQLEQLFGPQWRNVRLIAGDKYVVVLFGSDLELLQTALRNLAERKAEAAEELLLHDKSELQRDRKIQLHLSIAKAMHLLSDRRATKADPPESDDPLTSLSFSVKPDTVEIQVILPPKELKAAYESNFW